MQFMVILSPSELKRLVNVKCSKLTNSIESFQVGSGVEICLLCPGPTFSDLLEVAATENPGEKFGESMRSTDKRMTSERCAELSLIAIVNKLPESWICFR